jgi:20S proteasome alpha/beta subunit
MSILIGIICPDEAIVLVADSHITEASQGTFNSVNKISIVEFWPNDQVLVAQAGLWPLTNRIVEKMLEKAKGVRITSASTVTQIAEDSIRESKILLDEAQAKCVNENPSALMLAFYIERKPYLYTLNVDGHGIASSSYDHYATVGIGEYLADYLLKEYAVPKSHSDLAIATSIFVIKKVKDNTKYCGGDTTIRRLVPLHGFIDLDKQYIGQSEQIGNEFVNLAEARLVKLDEKNKKPRVKQTMKILWKTGTELWAKHIKKFQAEQELKQAQAKQQIGAAIIKHCLPAMKEALEKHRQNKP